MSTQTAMSEPPAVSDNGTAETATEAQNFVFDGLEPAKVKAGELNAPNPKRKFFVYAASQSKVTKYIVAQSATVARNAAAVAFGITTQLAEPKRNPLAAMENKIEAMNADQLMKAQELLNAQLERLGIRPQRKGK